MELFMKIKTTNDPEKKLKTYLLDGELDVHQVKVLKSTIMGDLEDAKDWNFTLDLKEIGYLDSSGLGILVYLKKEIGRQGGKLRLINLRDQVLSVFKLTKLEDFFELPKQN